MQFSHIVAKSTIWFGLHTALVLERNDISRANPTLPLFIILFNTYTYLILTNYNYNARTYQLGKDQPKSSLINLVNEFGCMCDLNSINIACS